MAEALFIFDVELVHDTGEVERLGQIERTGEHGSDQSAAAQAQAEAAYPVIGRYRRVGDRRIPTDQIEALRVTLAYEGLTAAPEEAGS